MQTTTPIDPDPIAELTTAIALGKTLADQAWADLTAAIPVLVEALRHQSGQSRKIENLLWSVWSDTHPVKLCDALAGLDISLAQAAVAMVAARAHLGGDADDLIRTIIDQSGILHPA
jgi:hypothetical protein